MANLQIIRLVNGQEIITEVLEEDDTGIKVKNPVSIVVMPNKNDPQNPHIGLAPWAQFSEDKSFVINKATVITTMKPIKEFINQYNSMFGGIVLPPSNLVLPDNYQGM